VCRGPSMKRALLLESIHPLGLRVHKTPIGGRNLAGAMRPVYPFPRHNPERTVGLPCERVTQRHREELK
jgi:hypothetical protein